MTVTTTPTASLTGRISAPPDDLLHDEVLAPQFRYERDRLLPYYLRIERVLLSEYRRLGVMTDEAVHDVAGALDEIDAAAVDADPDANMSDICFAVERAVHARVDPGPAWHVDRSRNDQQACAQAMFVRDRLLDVVALLLEAVRSTHRLAARYIDDPMPGYTHLQAAQVVTPAFVLTALSAHLLRSADRMLMTADSVGGCPLGSGAMAGGELAWDRDRMARMLGFDRPEPHALTGVASRAGALELLAELSTWGVGVSRIVTDLMAWGSSAYGFLTLPDSLSGISSAMPQKRNFPVLERIRGKTAHLTAAYLDAATGQRAVGYSNSVEASKEAGAALAPATDTACTVLRLLVAVLDRAGFDRDAMRDACAREFLGSSSLATALVVEAGIPWRTAQVVSGRYVVAATEAGLAPADVRPDLLVQAAAEWGHDVPDAHRLLTDAFDVDRALHAKSSAGGTAPVAVRRTLDEQQRDLERTGRRWRARAEASAGDPDRIDVRPERREQDR